MKPFAEWTDEEKVALREDLANYIRERIPIDCVYILEIVCPPDDCLMVTDVPFNQLADALETISHLVRKAPGFSNERN